MHPRISARRAQVFQERELLPTHVFEASAEEFRLAVERLHKIYEKISNEAEFEISNEFNDYFTAMSDFLDTFNPSDNHAGVLLRAHAGTVPIIAELLKVQLHAHDSLRSTLTR